MNRQQDNSLLGNPNGLERGREIGRPEYMQASVRRRVIGPHLLVSPALSQVQWDCCYYGSCITDGRSPQLQSMKVVSLTRLVCVKDALCAGRCSGVALTPDLSRHLPTSIFPVMIT